MQAHLLNAHGVVLDREERGESYIYFRILNSEAGLLTCMFRRAKAPRRESPDLFDHVDLVLERRTHGGGWFVREWRLIQRFQGIGESYAVLKEASLWARLVVANAQHMAHFETVLDVTLRALAAWDSKAPPAVIHLKALYLFCRDEGLPVKEQWLASLSAPLQQAARELISQPSGDAADQEDDAAELLTLLKRWASGQHYILVPGQ